MIVFTYMKRDSGYRTLCIVNILHMTSTLNIETLLIMMTARVLNQSDKVIRSVKAHPHVILT